MLIDLRFDTFRAGLLPDWLPHFQRDGLPAAERHGVQLLGCYTSETGTLNQFVQLWAYRDAAERTAQRRALQADPVWQALCAAAEPLLQQQENRLLKPTAFWPGPWPAAPAQRQETT